MSQLTRAQLEALWIANYTPTESDFDDVWESFFNLADDTGPTLDSIQFNLAAGVTAGEGEMAWNDTSKTVDLGLPGGVTMQIGQEIPLWVKNESGADVDNGDMVYVAGSTGVHLVVGLADASDLDKSGQVGMVTSPAGIADNGFGFVTRFGAVRGLNTTGTLVSEVWNEGDLLYLSAATPGALSITPPGTPNLTVEVGIVVSKNPSQGVIGVDPKQPHSADIALGTSDLVGPTQGAVKTYVDFQGATVTPTALQAIPDVTLTMLVFDNEVRDTNSYHDNATNNTRLTVPAGVSQVKCYGSVRLATDSDISVEVYKNGASVSPGRNAVRDAVTTSLALSTRVIDVSAGDYFELSIFQSSGGPLNTTETFVSFEIEVVR